MSTITAQRAALARELPEAGLAALLWLPVAAFVALLTAIAVACLVYLDVPVAAGVPTAVLDAERRQVELLARAAGGSAGRGAEDLSALVARSAGVPPEQLVRDVVEGPGGWRGAVVVNGGATQVARFGDVVPPVSAGGDVTVRAVTTQDGSPVLVTAVPLGDGTLLASSRLNLPDQAPAGTQRWLWLADDVGQITPVAGNPPVPTGPAGQSLTEVVTQVGVTSSVAESSGQLMGSVDAAGTAYVAAYAPVTGENLPGGLGVSLVTAIGTPTESGAPGGQGRPAAIALLALALAGGLLIYLTLVRPVQRLRATGLALAGGDLSTAPAPSRIREVADLAAAFEYCRGRLLDVPPVPPIARLSWPARRGVAVAVVSVIVWSVLVVMLAPTYLGAPTVPGAVVVDAQERVGLIADQAASSLNEGVAELGRTVTAAGPDPTTLDPALAQLLATSGRFRGVRIVDGVGQTVRSIGRPLLTGGVTAADGLSLAAAVAPAVPVPVVRMGLADGSAVIAEFDIQRLAQLLAMSPVRTRLLDGQLRTVSDTQGFLAFAPLADGPRRDLAAQTLRDGTTSGRVDDDAVLAVAPLGPGAAATLGWVVLAEEPVQALALSRTELQRRVAVLAVAASTVAIVVWAVYYLWHVRPLRRGARMAVALRGGDVETVIFPQYQGAVDTAVRCLDICRRALLTGPESLGPRVDRPEPAGTVPGKG